MSRSGLSRLVLCAALAFGVGVIPGVSAQQLTSAAPDQAGDLETAARELDAAMEEKRSELAGLGDQLDGATGDDVRAIRERGYEVVGEFMDDLEKLAENVSEREDLGLDVADDRARVTEEMEKTSALLQRTIDQTQGDLEGLRKALEEASGEDVQKTERALIAARDWLDRVLDLFGKHTIVMEEFSLDGSAEREFLTENLTRNAELISGRILVARERIEKLEARLKTDPANPEYNTDLDVANATLDRNVERLSETARMMEDLGLDTADYQQLLFQVTGEITTGLFSREVIGGLFSSWGQSVMDWLTDNGPGLILKIVIFVLILLTFRILSKIARKVVRKAIKRSSLQFSVLLERTTLSMTSSLVMIFGLLVALSQLGFQVGPLLAGLGVAGFIIGFALQDTLSNFASGMMILLYRPYDVGDLIETAGAIGKVENMTLVSTTILTVDHQTLVIPNSMIWGNVIKNVTAQTVRRIDMVFGIGYADDIPHAERVLTEIVNAHEMVLDDPEPVVKLHNLGESSVDFVVRPWVRTDDYWDVYWDITREVKIRFDAEKISIPFPQRDVHVYREGV